MSKYNIEKEKAREEARAAQELMSITALYYGEIAAITENLYKIGKRYGLIAEFRENGIIGKEKNTNGKPHRNSNKEFYHCQRQTTCGGQRNDRSISESVEKAYEILS